MFFFAQSMKPLRHQAGLAVARGSLHDHQRDLPGILEQPLQPRPFDQITELDRRIEIRLQQFHFLPPQGPASSVGAELSAFKWPMLDLSRCFDGKYQRAILVRFVSVRNHMILHRIGHQDAAYAGRESLSLDRDLIELAHKFNIIFQLVAADPPTPGTGDCHTIQR